MKMSKFRPSDVVDLNVGGVHYTTTVATLTKYPDSRLYKILHSSDNHNEDDSSNESLILHKERIFIDRDGILFRYILDYLRSDSGELILPETFDELDRLCVEVEYYQLHQLLQSLQRPHSISVNSSLVEVRSTKPRSPACINGVSPAIISSHDTVVPCNGDCASGLSSTITIGYRGTFAFGRGDGAGLSEVKFRKLLRITVAGRVAVCRDVFGDTLNESRDPDRGDNERYTSRFFLKHSFLEQAFDMLHEAGFRMIGAVASGTNGAASLDPKAAGVDCEETRWLHYNEFVFTKP